MAYSYDYIERETAKAIMFIYEDSFCWVPKSCILIKDKEHFETIDTFDVEWKHQNTYAQNKSKHTSKVIELTGEIKNDLWEYI